MAEIESWLTPEQVGEVLQLPKRIVEELCRAGEIPGAKKFGRRWRIPPSAVRDHGMHRPEARTATEETADRTRARPAGRSSAARGDIVSYGTNIRSLLR